MPRPLVASLVPAILGLSLLAAVPAEAAAPATPDRITAVTARPGPKTGQITLSWKTGGAHTTGFVLQTALNSFSKNSGTTAGTGRGARLTRLSRSRRSITLTASQVSALGAGVSSGNGLFFRFYALDTVGGRTTTRAYPYLQTVLPKPAAPKAKGTRLRVASFNVRTARATQDKRSWLNRAPDVARDIVSHHPGVVAIQELGPGRADGKTGTTKGTPRQTTSLLSALNRVGGKRYRLVRSTPYVAPGKPTATQGARILYDSNRYTLLSHCPENTGKSAYSSSCSVALPLLKGDSEKARRRMALAEFRDRSTGKRFWVASAHLDARHSSKVSTELSYDYLRWKQAATVARAVAHYNVKNEPAVVAGDFNSWQSSHVKNSAHDRMVQEGYYDTSAAVTRVNYGYTTFTGFKTTIPVSGTGIGVRLDMIFVKKASGASRFENVMKVTDSSRPSDHNMVLTDIVL